MRYEWKCYVRLQRLSLNGERPTFLYLFPHLIFYLIFNCRKIALQCCVGFCHTTAWISRDYTHVPQLLRLPPLPPSHHSRSSQSIKLGSLCYVATSHQLSIWHMVVYTCQCYFLHSSYSLLPPLHPQVCSLYLCLHSFLANRFINTIFLCSIYMH